MPSSWCTSFTKKIESFSFCVKKVRSRLCLAAFVQRSSLCKKKKYIFYLVWGLKSEKEIQNDEERKPWTKQNFLPPSDNKYIFEIK